MFSTQRRNENVVTENLNRKKNRQKAIDMTASKRVRGSKGEDGLQWIGKNSNNDGE